MPEVKRQFDDTVAIKALDGDGYTPMAKIHAEMIGAVPVLDKEGNPERVVLGDFWDLAVYGPSESGEYDYRGTENTQIFKFSGLNKDL